MLYPHPFTNYIGVWICSRIDLGSVEGKISSFCKESNPDSTVFQAVTLPLYRLLC
jgi:hypothetical protein